MFTKRINSICLINSNSWNENLKELYYILALFNFKFSKQNIFLKISKSLTDYKRRPKFLKVQRPVLFLVFRL